MKPTTAGGLGAALGFAAGLATGVLAQLAIAEVIVPLWAKDYINRIELTLRGEPLKKEYAGGYSYLPEAKWEGHTWVFRGQSDNRVLAVVTIERSHGTGESGFGWIISKHVSNAIDVYIDGAYKITIPESVWVSNWSLYTGYCTGYEYHVTKYE